MHRTPLFLLAAAVLAAACTDRQSPTSPGQPLFQTEAEMHALTAIEQAITDLQALIDADPANTNLRDKIEDAIEKLETARHELSKSRPDHQAAVGAIEGAVGDLEAAVKDGLLTAAQADGLIPPLLSEVSRLLAVAAIDDAKARRGDPVKIAEAEKARDDGDALGAAGKFKDAANKYKDALAIAEGAGQCANCVQQRVGADGATIVTPLQDAGVHIPAGAIPEGVEITVTIRPHEGRPCVPAHIPLFDECFEFLTDQGLFQFSPVDGNAFPVILAICVEVPEALTHAQAELLQLHQWDTEDSEGEEPTITVKALPNASAEFLPCDDEAIRFGSMGAVLEGLASIFRPRSLFAAAVVDVGVGGSTDAFGSIATWGLPSQMFPLEGTANQTADPGSAVETPPGVVVRDAAGNVVAGARVTFEVTAGFGTIQARMGDEQVSSTQVMATSDGDGIAALGSWTLGTSAGANTLRAFAFGLAGPDREEGPFTDQHLSVEVHEPVTLGTGEVIFRAAAAELTIDFDTDPNGNAVASGTVVNTLYSSQGVTFTRTTTGFCSSTTDVYANDHGPLPGGGFGFESGNNNVTVCPDGVASDFSENVAGRIEAQFASLVSTVCIAVTPTGFQDPDMADETASGFLEAFDANGTLLTRVESQAGAFGTICASATGIARVQFAGAGDAFAIFDNLSISPPPGAADLVVTNVIIAPSDPSDADIIFVTQEVANVGTTRAEPPIGIASDTEKDGFLFEGRAGAFITALEPGETRQRCCLQFIRDPGVYVQTTTIDHTETIPESDETNNSRVDRYTVTAGPSVLFQDDLEDDAVGGAPGTPLVGTWSGIETAGGTVAVESDFRNSAGAIVVESQLVVFTRTQFGALGLIGTVAGRPPTARVFALRFRAVVSADIETGPATTVQILSSNGSSIGFFSWDGFRRLQWNGEDTGVGWTPGVAQLFELAIDLGQPPLSDRRTSLSINGVPVEGFQDLAFLTTTARDIHRIVLGGGDAAAGFDDIEIVRQ